ncbi:hypothetical protein OB905_00590 [Halobacteria archaeon AArc-dxtr1]|nr:hypothetical protein [Halobacteria archaeon AArc-dxtr1]
MSDRTPTSLESRRTYRYLVVLELALSAVALALSIAVVLGLL